MAEVLMDFPEVGTRKPTIAAKHRAVETEKLTSSSYSSQSTSMVAKNPS